MHSVQQIYDELRRTLGDINKEIAEVTRIAAAQGSESHKLQDGHGALMLTPLLAAKASCLNGIAALKAAELRNKNSK